MALSRTVWLNPADVLDLEYAWCSSHDCEDCHEKPWGQRACQLQGLRIAYERALALDALGHAPPAPHTVRTIYDRAASCRPEGPDKAA